MNRPLSRLLLSVLAALIIQGSAGAAEDRPPLAAHVDAVIDRAMAEHRLVGVVVLIAQDGQLVYQRAAGFADREALRPVQPDTLFRLASVSKPIVTAAALALIERGRLSPDDPVTRWLPRFRTRLASGETPTITVRELLTHTSGLGYGFLEPIGGPYHSAGVSDGLDQPGLSMQENLRRLSSVPLRSPPGTAWHYSLSTDVLGAIIERVTHKPLERALRELITDPLGMRDTSFGVLDASRLAAPYVNRGPLLVRMRDPEQVPFPPDAPPGSAAGLAFAPSRAFDPRSYPSGGGGLIATAADVLKFLEAIRRGGQGVLSPASAHSMMVNQIGNLPGVFYGPGWEFGLGGAVLVDPVAAHSPQGVGTWRWGGVYGGTWFVDPTRKLTLVSLSNTTPEGVRGTYVDELVNAVYQP